MRLPFEADAAAELEDAAAWYERERRGYGALFMSEIRRTVERAADLPQSGTAVSGTDPEHDVRRFVVRCFPYSVITALVAGERAVVAVAHGHRRPGYWRDRVK
jgi:plasmid stabilization system protein ParE